MVKSDASIRLETSADWTEVENLTREAFWNVYRPGCMEHYVLHCYRSLPEFIPELSCVMETDHKIIAHIMYSKAEVVCDDGKRIPIMIFGPVSVLPEYQGKGYGSRLIVYTLEKAKNLGCGAVAITGNPAYYNRFGFRDGQSFRIYYANVPRGEPTPFFMIKELKPGYLDGVIGTYTDPDGYFVDDSEVDAFDKSFPPKVKEKRPGQLV
jgi:Predicted acetyltransferase